MENTAKATLTPVVGSFSRPVACFPPPRVGGKMRRSWGACVAANKGAVAEGLAPLGPKVVYVSPNSGKASVHRHLNSSYPVVTTVPEHRKGEGRGGRGAY